MTNPQITLACAEADYYNARANYLIAAELYTNDQTASNEKAYNYAYNRQQAAAFSVEKAKKAMYNA